MKLKQNIILLVFVTLFSGLLKASDLDVFLTVNRFHQSDVNESYVEISYLVPAVAVNFVKSENEFQAKLKVSLSLRNDKGFYNSKVYVLQTSKYLSLDNAIDNLTDVIRLTAPKNDTIQLDILIEDVNDSTFFFSTVAIYIPEVKSAFLSDVMLINTVEDNISESPFNRNNMKVVPKFMNYYPTEITEIKFYCEFYQIEKTDNFLVSYLLTNEEGLYIDGYAAHKKVVNKNYDAIISGFDISKLPSGNYYLFVELKDSKNNTIERKRTFFQRNNKNELVVENLNKQKNELDVITNNFAKKYDLKNIKHHLNALDAIANSWEKATIESFKNSTDLDRMQNYFFSFWAEKNSADPELEWKAYATKLQFVEKEFTNMSYRGYETARGRTYLRFGAPTSKRMVRSKSKGEFWLWEYEKLESQGNVKFVFLNRSEITNDFVIVHTDLKGEISDKNWAEYLKTEF